MATDHRTATLNNKHCCTTPGKMNPNEIKFRVLRRNTVHGTTCQHQDIIYVLKCGLGNIMIWGCFSATRTRLLFILKGKMNVQVYQNILHNNVRTQTLATQRCRSALTLRSNAELLKKLALYCQRRLEQLSTPHGHFHYRTTVRLDFFSDDML